MANTVTVLLNARDNISGMLGGLKANLGGLGDSTNGLRDGVFAAGVQMQMLEGAIQMASKAATALSDQLMTAAKLQTEITVAGDTVGKNMGVGLQGGVKMLRETRLELGKVADLLPGVTSDYTNVANSVMPALSKLGLSEKELQALTVKISTGGGFMGQATGMGATTGTNMLKLLSGSTSINRIMQNDVFERYSGDARGKMNEALATAGVKEKDWGKITPQQRANIVADFSSKIATPELAAELSKGLDSKMSTLVSFIFDPERGIFGFLKPVAARGGRTGLDAATELFDVFGKLAALLPKVDLDGVMTAIIDSIDWFSQLGYTIIGMTAGGDNAIGEIYKNLYEGIVSWFNSAVSMLSTMLSNIDFKALGAQMGEIFGHLFMAIQNIDWMGVIVVAVKIIIGIVEFVGNFILAAIVTVVKSTFSQIGKALSNMFGFILNPIGDAFAMFGEKFKQVWDTAIRIIQPIVDFFVSGFENTVGAVKAVSSAVANPVGAVTSAATAAVTNPDLGSNIVNGVSTIGNFLGNPTGAAVDFFNPLPSVDKKKDNTSFAPTINLQANANMSTGEQVNMLMAAINDKYREYQQGVLA